MEKAGVHVHVHGYIYIKPIQPSFGFSFLFKRCRSVGRGKVYDTYRRRKRGGGGDVQENEWSSGLTFCFYYYCMIFAGGKNLKLALSATTQFTA